MLHSFLACLAVVCGVACNEPPPPLTPVTLRVGASGLSSFRARTLSGDTSHAMELAYSLVRDHAKIQPLGATRLALRALPASPLSHASLCDLLLDDAGVERRTPTPDGCVLEFDSIAARSRFAGYPWLMLDHGPFRWEREIPDSVRSADVALPGHGSIHAVELVSRGHTAIDRIHITAMPLHEAWRRLFARQLDVIPGMTWQYLPHFAGMRSVRAIPVPVSAYMHVFFNTRLPAWADPDLRRHVARILEPQAVAMLACGDPACAVESWRPAPPAAEVELPARITILVLSSDSSAVTAARAISYRIRLHHEVDIDVEPVSIETLARIEQRSDYALVLAPMGILSSADPDILAQSLSVFAGYDSAEFIAAAEGGATAEMQRILERDVPALPLYEERTFAAVDARFCGGRPHHATSWAWLAELHPCAEAPP